MGTATRFALAPPSHLVKDRATGAVAIASSFTAVRPCKLISVTCKFDIAPVANGDFTVTLDALAGGEYDATLYRVDPGATSTASIVWQLDQPLWLAPGDEIDVAYANTNTRTYGVEMTFEEAG